MEHSFHSFSELFKQLGLGSSHEEIEGFLSEHAPLSTGMLLSEAPFWSPAQAAFCVMREKLTVTGQRSLMR